MNKFHEWLLIFRNVVIALVVIAVGEALPPLQALERTIAPQRIMLAWATGTTAFLGFVFLMGATLYRIRTGGGSLNRAEIEQSVKSVKDGLEIPYSSRVSRYWVPKKAWGAGFSDEVPIAQFKAAWKQGLWRTDPRWRGLLIMGLGALLMAAGGFGIIIVLAAPGLKFLAGLALLYAAARTVWAFARA